MTPRLEKALIALSAAAVPLLAAGAGWVKADTEQKEKLALAENYGEYIRDNMSEQEDFAAMERALDRCMARLADR